MIAISEKEQSPSPVISGLRLTLHCGLWHLAMPTQSHIARYVSALITTLKSVKSMKLPKQENPLQPREPKTGRVRHRSASGGISFLAHRPPAASDMCAWIATSHTRSRHAHKLVTLLPTKLERTGQVGVNSPLKQQLSLASRARPAVTEAVESSEAPFAT